MRMHTTRGFMLLVAMALLATMLPLGIASADEHGIEHEIVVDGLRNPRQMDIAAGHLYVAEAGIGGQDDSDCFATEPEEPDSQICYGHTSRVTRVNLADDTDEVVLDELPSLAGPGSDEEPAGWFAVGAHDVSLRAPDDGVVIMGLGAPPEFRQVVVDETGEPRAGELGTLRHANFATDTHEPAADLAAYEQAENPDGGDPEELGIDTNPYSVLLDGDDAVVADAGGNSLLRVPVDAMGGETDTADIETIAVFPRNPQPFPRFIPEGPPPGFMFPGDSVPTSIFQDDEGDYLVGELPGFPFQPGAARVWSVDGDGTEVDPDFYADGFATIIDLAIGPDGHLYVLEIANLGLIAAEFEGEFRGGLVRYHAETGRREVLLTDPLFAPGGMAFDEDGTLYIANCSVCGDTADAPEMTGHILRLTGVEDAEPLAFTEPVDAETDENQPVEIDVLDNDSEGLEIVAVVDQGNGATLVNTITYQPRAHFSGEDRIKYQACNDEACVIGEAGITVNPLATGRYNGSTRIETAVRVSRGHFPAGANHVIIARSDRYPDALTGGVLAAAVNAPVLLTPSDQLHPAVIEEINRLAPATAYILGGNAAIAETVEDAVVAQTSVQQTIRVSGANRFATAAEVRDEVAEVTGVAATEVYVAEGQHENEARGWPDVLSVSYLAGNQLRPILLVTRDLLHPDTEASLREGVAAATIVGGDVAVSNEVAAQIDEIVDDVDRVFGTTRYETSYAIAELAVAAGMDPDFLYLATGRNWPDALAAGPAVALDGSVLLLVDSESLDNSPPVRTYLREHRPFADIDLLGGVGAISTAVEQQVSQEAVGG